MCIFVIVHPNLENISLNPNLGAELVDGRIVLPLNPPPNPLREFKHLILLLRREFRPKPLPTTSAAAAPGGSGRRRPHVILSLRRLRRPPLVLSLTTFLVTITRTVPVVVMVLVTAGRPDDDLRVPPGRGGTRIVQ